MSKPWLSHCCNAPIWKISQEKMGDPSCLYKSETYICEKCQKVPAMSPEAKEHLRKIIENWPNADQTSNS